MKHYYWIFTALILATSCANIGKPIKECPHHDELRDRLGTEMTAILTQPDRVMTYRVTPRPGQSEEQLGPYFILARGPELAGAALTNFITTLMNPESYDFVFLKKNVFVPEYAFDFEKEGEHVLVFVSLFSLKVEFHHREKTVKIDTKPSAEGFAETVKHLKNQK